MNLSDTPSAIRLVAVDLRETIIVFLSFLIILVAKFTLV